MTIDVHTLIGRDRQLFSSDIAHYSDELKDIVNCSSFLVLGGAGSIGQSVVKEIFKRSPKKLYVVDISENNLAELVRDIRSSFGYIAGDFQCFSIDIGSIEYDVFIENNSDFDYILNLSALKHVRSEKDPFTLMRMIDVNILNTNKTIRQGINVGIKKYFCVSTDKATSPVNMMGASKSIMEMFLAYHSQNISISTARFANVAFSDGSLLHSFNLRMLKEQPIVAPNDIWRYFITAQESGELCLLSCLLGKNMDIFYPKLDKKYHLSSLVEIAKKYITTMGFQPVVFQSEEEARANVQSLIKNRQWPCYFSESNTTGEKTIEEFFTENEVLDNDRFNEIGVVKGNKPMSYDCLDEFEKSIYSMKKNKKWNKQLIIELFQSVINEFNYEDVGFYLDGKM